jgi:hypothetical protein
MNPNRTGRFSVSDIRAAVEEDRVARYLRVAAALIFMGFLVVCLIILLACERSDQYKDADRTPEGYHVYIENAGLLGSGLATYDQVKVSFDEAMKRSAATLLANNGVPEAVTLRLPFDKEIYFVLVDHFRFPSLNGGYAVGEEGAGRIKVGMHLKRSAPWGSAFPSTALPWTHVYGDQQVNIYWGECDLRAAFPALAHELGHAIFGAGFEHDGLVYRW